MSQVINTNILSLNAQRNLSQSQGALGQSLERLSSGLRINSAKDDAAGLAISERFSTQINGLNQAVRNANDGISFSQTAEGALSTVGDALQRIRELSVQAANDSNSASDREALNNEAQQLVAEISRVANETEFNGDAILDGALNDIFFQIGANQGQNIAVSGADARATELGRVIAEGSEGLTQTQINDVGIEEINNITINLEQVGVLGEGEDNDLGVELEVDLEGMGVNTLEDAVREINAAIASPDPDNENVGSFVSGEDLDDEEAMAALRDAGLSAALVTNDDGETTIAIRGNFDTEFSVDGGGVTLEGGDTTDPDVTLFDSDGDGAAVDGQTLNLTDVDIASRSGATEALAVVDGALDQVNSLRADLGSIQVRFENTIANLEISSENLDAARSRIRDADFAEETAELTRAQILQQAGTSVLSQANATSQNVLALLQ
ncbi:flagellin domain protein [Thioalkalivibrio sp. K90mix]|uniref:flagellin N-terminal helical domain-containing protein n=1 Tax=Thioalkalivibrio sp. (strain K90mix) TaxID=396595 RepID=UPI000195A928|nr:flagellin [Thioalkalivibrio sp. K90mix]ADC71952.1 flagellin domain protein [Thioalkalivibrio sp. K90mix]